MAIGSKVRCLKGGKGRGKGEETILDKEGNNIGKFRSCIKEDQS